MYSDTIIQHLISPHHLNPRLNAHISCFFYGWLFFKLLNQFYYMINFHPENTTVWPMHHSLHKNMFTQMPLQLLLFLPSMYSSNACIHLPFLAILLPCQWKHLKMKWTAYCNLTQFNTYSTYFYLSLYIISMISMLVFQWSYVIFWIIVIM